MELATEADLGLAGAAKVALSSMISTARANLSVGPPYDLGVYRPGSHRVAHVRIDADSPFLARLEEVWARNLARALEELPTVEPGDVELLPRTAPDTGPPARFGVTTDPYGVRGDAKTGSGA